MSHMERFFAHIAVLVATSYPSLESVHLNGIWCSSSGYSALHQFENLKELYLDNSILNYFPENFLSHCNGNLERVSLKGTKTQKIDEIVREPRPLPDEVLMKFVRATPTLRWFRSDLSLKAVAILKQERPEVQFSASQKV